MELRWTRDNGRELAASVDPRGWTMVTDPDPDACVRALSRPGDPQVTVVVDGERVQRLRPHSRDAARVAVVSGRIGDLPTLRVADVVLLGLHAPSPGFLWALLGTRSARQMSADDEAHARALAGRVGLAPWMDATAVALPSDVEALVDLTRGLAGRPHGLVWRRPEWLDGAAVERLRDTIRAEQALAELAVAEFATAAPDTLPAS